MRLPSFAPTRGARPRCAPRYVSSLLLFLALGIGVPQLLSAQDVGTISGRVTRADDQSPLAGVQVSVNGTGLVASTGTDGRYTVHRVPAGERAVTFRWIGYRPVEATVRVVAGQRVTLDAALQPAPVQVTEIVVEGASRAPEKVVEAPAAVSVIEPEILQSTSITGQAPLALSQVPGVDVVQNGVNDFNVNARGFNSSLNRRVLVLQDNRDLAIAFLGSQEWNGLATSLQDLGRIEVVRGPGSALYGANAFSGVIALTTPTAREVAGSRLTFGGGELESFRADLSQASTFSQGRFGYRLLAGYSTSDTWTRSRTAADGQDLAREYADATDEQVGPARESVALAGQTPDPLTGEAQGDRDPVKSYYSSLRLDHYRANGDVATADGGFAIVENEVFVTGIGRVQVRKAMKPYARLEYAAERFSVFGWWNGRNSLDPQVALATGADLEEKSNVFHIEGQYNHSFASERGRFIVGTSARALTVNTDTTLMRAQDDDRSDQIYSLYGQVEWRLNPQVKLVGAARIDDGNLFETQFSPKGAIVYQLNDDHSFHLSVNRAFMTPNYSEWFLRVNAGLPANLTLLENGLRAHPQLGPALAGVPNGTLFTTTAAVPVLALGNAQLEPEQTLGFELGYKGNISDKLYMSLDLFSSTLSHFVTDLLPGVNPTYGLWTAPAQVPQNARAQLEAAVRTALISNPATAIAGRGLTRLENGNTAIVVSYANAGEVVQRGAELGVGYRFTNELRGDASLTLFDFEVKEASLAGDQLLPNTPSKKATLGMSYVGRTGFDGTVSIRLVDGYQWAAGVFQGYVPASEIFNASLGYRINNYFRFSVTGTNIFDQQRFSLYGGAVIGRRVIGAATVTF